MSEIDFLLLGSGLASLSFAALAAQQGYKVCVLEAHEHFGGYGHTFTVGDYSFNAQLHYVTSCGQGDVVNRLLKHLGLEEEVTFERLSPEGYDRAYCEGHCLKIPNDYDQLQENMCSIMPSAKDAVATFIKVLKDFSKVMERLPGHMRQLPSLLSRLGPLMRLLPYKDATLQQVFDRCKLPKLLQTLVSGQLIDYMLPPNQLSFVVWAMLFNAYTKGAYYPKKHFDHVINSLVEKAKKHNATFLENHRVVSFITQGRRVLGVKARSVDPLTGLFTTEETSFTAKQTICNFDPKLAAEMIGNEKFSYFLRRKLDYDYSPSSFVLYGVVEGLPLEEHGFGPWNIWHCQPDHNVAFKAMLEDCDYSKPYFAMNCRSLHSSEGGQCKRPNCQTFEICTAADYGIWKRLKLADSRAYNKKKKEVLDCFLDVIEEQYIPNFRDHLIFRMTGTPTTNERYVNAPQGGCYGVNLVPRNFQLTRKLTSHTSLKDFHFCCAASGVGGFAGTIHTGVCLFEKLAKVSV